MGFGVDEGSLEENDDDLEAELLALTQGPPQNRGKKGCFLFFTITLFS